MSDPWWPEGYRYPAFQVRRQPYGTELGGDYVRGSAGGLPKTAIRYPTQAEGFDAIANKALLFARPVPPHTILRSALFDRNGQFVRNQEMAVGTAEVQWGWPTELTSTWSEMSLVRSGFGAPITVNDGVTIYRKPKSDFVDEAGVIVRPPPLYLDTPLTPGHWYYYSLFFKTGVYDWVIGMTTSVVIPRDYHHAEHLWDTVPPFYQNVDSNLREGDGPLHRFLAVFGFELDTTREYVEQWQEVYHIDKSPMPLLRHLGENLDVPYRAAVGDVRYRSLLAGLPEMLKMRGTTTALLQMIESFSKYDADITVGGNLMILPDDSDFFTGTGSWAALHPITDTLETVVSTPVADDVYIAKNPPSVSPPPSGYGRGTMRVTTSQATETSNLTLACGDGIIDDREVIPLYAAVPVQAGGLYGFSIQIKTETVVSITPKLMWFGASGQPDSWIETIGTEILSSTAGVWFERIVQGVAPDDAFYVVPALYFTSRLTGGTAIASPYIDLAGASVYLLGQEGNVTLISPDKYLTLGDPAEVLAGENLLGSPS